MIAEEMEEAAADLELALDKLRWLARLQRLGKLPARLHGKCRKLTKEANALTNRLINVNNGDLYLNDPAIRAEFNNLFR